MEICLANITHKLWKIYDGYITLGRLYALKSLGNKQIDNKLTCNANCYRNIEAASRIARFMQKNYAKKEPLVHWPKHLLPATNGILIDTNLINLKLLDEVIRDLSATLAFNIYQVHNLIHHHVALQAMTYLLMEIASWLPYDTRNSTTLDEFLGEKNTLQQGLVKAFSGPMHVSLDNAFTPSYSILSQSPPDYGHHIRHATPYYWCLSARECLAADMCALSLLEYDGLPIDFYTDMAKQAYDEIRHAAIFLNITKTLMPDFKACLQPDEELFMIAARFEKYGSGLPIPLERNLFETIWNTTLDERFILMHYDTEAPGIHRLRQKLESSINKKYPFIGQQIEIVMREEVTHARIGDRWLKYLIPNPIDRANAIQHARLMRGILILTSSAHYTNKPLHSLIDNMLKRHSNEPIANQKLMIQA